MEQPEGVQRSALGSGPFTGAARLPVPLDSQEPGRALHPEQPQPCPSWGLAREPGRTHGLLPLTSQRATLCHAKRLPESWPLPPSIPPPADVLGQSQGPEVLGREGPQHREQLVTPRAPGSWTADGTQEEAQGRAGGPCSRTLLWPAARPPVLSLGSRVLLASQSLQLLTPERGPVHKGLTGEVGVVPGVPVP